MITSQRYWLQTKFFIALKGIRNHSSAISGRLEEEGKGAHIKEFTERIQLQQNRLSMVDHDKKHDILAALFITLHVYLEFPKIELITAK